jgi:ubiquinone/menaquinone biosynthesis C-methylase UbiE
MTMTPADVHRIDTARVLQAIGEDEPTLRAYTVSLLGVSAGATVLDVGSGPGSSVAAVQATGARVICLDPEPSMLALTQLPRPQL